MPRPRGADAAGLLLRELELHPPAEEWHRRNMFGGPWSDPGDTGPLDYTSKSKFAGSDHCASNMVETSNEFSQSQCLWPRKRRTSERDAAFGLKTSVGLGTCLGIMGSRRDVVTATWKTGLEGVWYKVAFSSFSASFKPLNCLLIRFEYNEMICSRYLLLLRHQVWNFIPNLKEEQSEQVIYLLKSIAITIQSIC